MDRQRLLVRCRILAKKNWQPDVAVVVDIHGQTGARQILPDTNFWQGIFAGSLWVAIQRPESVGALYRWTGNISSGKKGCSTNACRLDSSKMYHHLNLRRSNLFFGIASVWQGA